MPSPPGTPAEERALVAKRKARERRDALKEKLELEDADDLTRRLNKCGETFNLLCCGCGGRHVVEKRCDLKWCPACQRALAARTSLRYESITKECRWPLLTTWTTKNFDGNGFDFVRSVRRSFARMRRLRWWKRCVNGGVASIEVTNTGNGWHPHVHALLDCEWLSVTVPKPRAFTTKERWKAIGRSVTAELADQWTLCLRRPGSVKVRRLWKSDQRDAAPAIREVLKYSCKGSDLLECHEPIAPLIRMLDGSRLVTSWGTFYGHPATKRPRGAAGACQRCGGDEWLPEMIADKYFRALRAT